MLNVSEYSDKTVVSIDSPCAMILPAGTKVYYNDQRHTEAPVLETPLPEPEKTVPVYDLNSHDGIVLSYLARHMDVPTDEKTVATLHTWARELIRQLTQQGQTLVGMSCAQQTALIDQMLGNWKQGPSH